MYVIGFYNLLKVTNLTYISIHFTHPKERTNEDPIMYKLILPNGFRSSYTHTSNHARKLFLGVNIIKIVIIFKLCRGEISFMFDTLTYGKCYIEYRKM
jgi:hypothetical protein